MKSLRIDFRTDQRWFWLWISAALCAVCLAGVTAAYWQKAGREGRHLESRNNIHRQQIARLGASKTITADPKQASAEQAAQLLQQDLNKAFTSAENLKEPGVRLLRLELDGGAGVLRLEFELDAVTKASAVSAALNAGYETRPWQLESVTGATGGSQAGFAPATALRGLWTAQLSKL